MQAIQRTFSILRIIAQQEGQIGVNAIAAKLGLAKSTTSRFLSALEAEGVIVRSADNRFAIGPEITRLAQQTPFTQSLAVAARPELQALTDQTGEASALCVPNGNQTLFLDHVPSQHMVQVMDWTGHSVPLHTASSGKLFLADASSHFVDRYLARPLEAFTDKTITSAKALRAELVRAREQGYAITDEEFAESVVGYAVPIYDKNDKIIAAIMLYGPKFRFEELSKPEDLVALLRKHADRIQVMMGM